MRWIAEITDTQPLYFVIENAQAAGFYLYFYRGNFCIRDNLQDTFDIAANQASREYKIPKDSWKLVKENPNKWVAENVHIAPLKFFIEQDQKSKFHLCIYQGDNKLYDNPKNSLDDAENFALEKLQVPRLSWKQLSN